MVGGPTYVVDLLDDPGDPYPGPYQDEAKDHLGLKSVETPDDRTVVFHLRTADPDFPYVLALPSSSPGPFHGGSGASANVASWPDAAAEHRSRVRSTQNRAASARAGSPIIWCIRLNRWARPADPWQMQASTTPA